MLTMETDLFIRQLNDSYIFIDVIKVKTITITCVFISGVTIKEIGNAAYATISKIVSQP